MEPLDAVPGLEKIVSKADTNPGPHGTSALVGEIGVKKRNKYNVGRNHCTLSERQ